MAYHQPFQITGFHSCDKELGMRLVEGSDELRLSDNPWDWLGPGIYFWEQNPHRALAYAEEAAKDLCTKSCHDQRIFPAPPGRRV